jgi:hypothetical protein
MNSAPDTLAGGFPHSEIPGSPIARISPGLFAACHVLHRLSVPRHPPDALASRLITGVFLRKKTPHHRRAQGQNPSPCLSRGQIPRQWGPKTQAASHEDTSSDRLGTSSGLHHPTGEAWFRPNRRTPATAGVRACPPRSHHNSLSSPFNQRPPRGSCRKAVGWLAKRPEPGRYGGGERIRTDDLLLAKQALSQLSYTPLPGIRKQGSGSRSADP